MAASPSSGATVILSDFAYVDGMRILILGAGVIGSVYGARLLERGHQVVVLARGHRLTELQEHGLILEDAERGQRTVWPVPVVDGITAEDRYDLVLAPVRRDQLRGIVPVVRKLSDTPAVLIFGNATGLCSELRASLGERVLFGFPAAGGTYDGKVVRYVLIRQQKTMLGEPDGRASSRMRSLGDVFAEAGFSTSISRNVAGWLNAHTAFVVPIAYALYRFDTDAARLAPIGRRRVRWSAQPDRRFGRCRQPAKPTSQRTSRCSTCGCPRGSQSATGDGRSPDPAVSCGSPRIAARLPRRWLRSPPSCSPPCIGVNVHRRILTPCCERRTDFVHLPLPTAFARLTDAAGCTPVLGPRRGRT